MAAGYPVPHEHQHVMSGKKAKPHQKQEQFDKPYQKQEHKGWQQPELPFNDDKPWRTPTLTDTEIEELFWGKLVQLGWKLQAYGTQPTRRNNIVLPCPECNLVIDSHTILTEQDARKMQDKSYCEALLKKHKGVDCKVTPEDEE